MINENWFQKCILFICLISDTDDELDLLDTADLNLSSDDLLSTDGDTLDLDELKWPWRASGLVCHGARNLQKIWLFVDSRNMGRVAL